MKTNQLEDIKQTVRFNAPIQKVWDTVSTFRGNFLLVHAK